MLPENSNTMSRVSVCRPEWEAPALSPLDPSLQTHPLSTSGTLFPKFFIYMIPGFGEMITRLSSFIHMGPLLSLNTEFLLGFYEYQNWPRGPLFGVHRTGRYLGSLLADHTSDNNAVISLRTFHEEHGHRQQGKQTAAGLHALCSLGHDQYDKGPQRPLAVP